MEKFRKMRERKEGGRGRGGGGGEGKKEVYEERRK